MPGHPCPIAAAWQVVGDRWALLVVREVHMGAQRFSDILAGTGAPRDRLSARLKELVAAGILYRQQYQDSPPRSAYHLTQAGDELLPVILALKAWGRRWAVDAPGGESST